MKLVIDFSCHKMCSIMLVFCLQYSVVTFIEEEGEPSDVVPSSWLLPGSTKCYWPDKPKKGQIDRRSSMIASLQKPQPGWATPSILFRHSYGTFTTSLNFNASSFMQ